MDRITESLLKSFSKDYSVTTKTEDKLYEYFCTHLLIGNLIGEDCDFSELNCGGGNDLGIDSIAIIVNDNIILTPQEVKEIASDSTYLEVTFAFIQTETSSSFDGQKLGNFADGIKEFFSNKPSLPRNEKIENFASIMATIFNYSGKFTRGNPNVISYYVTTGTWTTDPHLEAKRKQKIKEIKEIDVFKDVELKCLDRLYIQNLYNSQQNSIAREFVFDKKVAVPEIEGVQEAYLGILPAKEFLKLIEDDSNNIQKSLFYDNVRDWQDFNEVNTEIKTSLTMTGRQPRFSLMNNGVTIIAKILRVTGNKFHMEDYQIVNGCQTSHVIHANRLILTDQMMVPLRIISTSTEEIISGIIKATNRQTEVSQEQLLAISDFQKQLEALFSSYEGKKQLYYERRSRQYNHQNDIEKVRVITPTSLIRTFSSMFLNVPHRTMRSYKTLLGSVGKDLFAKDHKLALYYACAYAYYKLEFYFRNGQVDVKYKVCRFHILLAVKIICCGNEELKLNSKSAEKVAKILEKILWNDATSIKIFDLATKLIDVLVKGPGIRRDVVHTESFTEKLIAQAATLHAKPATTVLLGASNK